jgi:hypothetical protein
LHVFVPIERTVTFDQARVICETVGRHLLRAHPREITMEWATVKRTGKIFIDFNMNVRGKTLNVAFSPRGVAGAPVSMPLTWEELEAAEPTDFTVLNAMRRLDRTGDRWHHVLEQKQSLARAFGSVARTSPEDARGIIRTPLMAAPRSIGSLTISFGLVAIPVKLYTATQSTGRSRSICCTRSAARGSSSSTSV